MHLYMYSEFSKEIANITLRHGCCPCIGDQASDQLEPAIWFKVLVLDAVSIDCNKRTILWHTSTDLQALKAEDTTAPKSVEAALSDKDTTDAHISRRLGLRRNSSRRVIRRQISESVYAGGECMGYGCDLDLVYDFTQDILSQFANGEISQSDFNKEIFRLLHIHILPKIRLSADDVINVQDAGAIVDSYVSDIDEMILSKQGKIDRVLQDVKKQRNKFTEDMSQPEYYCVFSPTMAGLLLQQINEDLVSAQQKLEEITQEVEAVKEVILSSVESEDTSSNSSTGEQDLSRLRERRDKFLNDQFNKLLTARAVLDDYIKISKDGTSLRADPSRSSKKAKAPKKVKSKKSKKKSKGYSPADEEDPLHATYMGMVHTHEELIKDIQRLAHQKVLQISVKEAIRGVLQVLLCGQETSGVDIDPTGLKCPTDVMRHSRIPMEWLSLAEQVATVVQDEQLTLSKTHQAFCDKVREMCNAALQQRKLSDLSVSIEQESGPPTLSPTHHGGLFAQNKLYNLKHGLSVTRDSERSSGFSSRCPSESEASRTSNFSHSVDTTDLSNSTRVSKQGSNTKLLASGDLSGNSTQMVSSVQSSSDPGSVRGMDFQRSSEATDSITSNLEHSMDSTTGNSSVTHVINSEEYAILETNDIALTDHADELEAAIEKVRVYVNAQFEEMCHLLQEHLGYTGDVYYKKIWQCYETHFFGESMDSICQLYCEAYASKFQNVLNNLSSLTAGDLDLSSFIINTLVEVGRAGSTIEDLAHPVENNSMTNHVLDIVPHSQERSVVPDVESFSERTLTPSNGCASEPVECSEQRTDVLSENASSQHGSWDVIADIGSASDSSTTAVILCGHSTVSNPSDRSKSFLKKTPQRRKLPESMKLDLLPFGDTNSLDRSSTLESTDCDHKSQETISLSENTSTSSGETSKSSSSEQVSSSTSSEQSFAVHPGIPETDEKPRVIKISQPTSTTLIYDRHTWPNILQDPLLEYTVIHEVPEFIPESNNNFNLIKTHLVAPLSPTVVARNKTTLFERDVRGQFKEAFDAIEEALKDTSPLHKLQHLVKCLKEINRCYQQLQLEYCGEKSIGVCADELIDILVLFLCNCPLDMAQKLYAQIMMLSHFLPWFFEGGPFSFTLVQFSAAFQVLQDRLLMKSKKAVTESEA